MKKTNVCLIALLASIFLTSALVSPAPGQRRAEKDISGKTASVSGLFTGTLDGKITIGGTSVLITRKTTFFKPGSGALKKPVRTVKKPVYVSGMYKRGVLVANIVIISDDDSSARPVPLTDAFLKPGKGDQAQ